MTLWAIVPVKPLRRGKSRLSSVLSLEARTALNHYLLSNTLETLAAVPEYNTVPPANDSPAEGNGPDAAVKDSERLHTITTGLPSSSAGI